MKDFFVSYNWEDRRWAEWIAWELENAEFSVVIQAWDFVGNWVLEMNRAMAETERTIAVLSPNYVGAQYTQTEWAEAFRRDPTGEKDLLIPIRVAPVELAGIFAQIVYVDFIDTDEATAAELLLKRVRHERGKPSERPAYPGARTIAFKPAYPGFDQDRQRLLRARGILASWRNDHKAHEEELRAAGEKARAWSRKLPETFDNDAAAVISLAANAARDLRGIPLHELEFATRYGLQVHPTVFWGQALTDVLDTVSRYGPGRSAELVQDDEARASAGLPVDAIPDQYAFEMAARVLESACALAGFSLDKLPHGFIDASGPGGDLSAYRTLMVARINADPALHLMSVDEKPQRLGSFAARSLPLFPLCARRNGDGSIDVMATDFENIFRWSGSNAHPSMQYSSESSVNAAAFVSSAYDAPVIAAHGDGKISIFDAGGGVEIARDSQQPGPRKSSVWIDPLTPKNWYVLTLTNEYDMTSQARDGSVSRRPAESLWSKTAAGKPMFWNDYAVLVPTVLEGFPCVVVHRQHYEGQGVLFLDPVSLSSLRPPLFIDGFAGAMVVAAGRWLVVLFHQRGLATLPRIGLWDLTTNSTEPIGRWLERAGDAYEPFVAAEDESGFEVLFVLNRFDAGQEKWLCRFRWPSGTVDELERYSSLRILPVTTGA